ncbi:hypothetical protein J437_LFUL016341 [Ladona fulva]|uniref:Peptidase aspartic putative domain-containing protein n=1 Tax=Ladona fulva TaxID=123851 RepID=A0A8K0KIW2_LADFU|nr:hypothetical protein J437_LFUL016341 [Ladona fulva]
MVTHRRFRKRLGEGLVGGKFMRWAKARVCMDGMVDEGRLPEKRKFMAAGPIDLLLGASVHAHIVEGRIKKGAPNQPIATETALGWIISGETNHGIPPSLISTHHSSTEMSLDSLPQRFWQQEEVTSKCVSLTPDEEACENHFSVTHFRNEEGRYVASPEFHNAYREFMEEYISLGHMQPLSEPQVQLDKYFFLPHHGVLKESCTTKLRVVFNGSVKTDSGLTLNDCLHAGPNLLSEIVPLVTSWHSVLKRPITKIVLLRPSDN